MQYRKQGRKPAISGKRRSEHSRVGEKDRADGRAGYGSGESRPRRKERGQESRRAMGDKEEGGASLFPHQIVDFHLHLHPHLHSLYLAALSLTHTPITSLTWALTILHFAYRPQISTSYLRPSLKWLPDPPWQQSTFRTPATICLPHLHQKET